MRYEAEWGQQQQQQQQQQCNAMQWFKLCPIDWPTN